MEIKIFVANFFNISDRGEIFLFLLRNALKLEAVHLIVQKNALI